MHELVDLLGRDKVVFVTHVNAMTPDNVPIEQRAQLIAAVTASAQRIGVPCYDPTPLMNKIGQADAMEDGGLDLTHYTPLFAERLYTEWFKTFVRPRMSTSTPQPSVPKLSADEGVERIEKIWDSGDLREASRRLRDVLRRHPGLPDHTLLFARFQEELGDYEGSLALLGGADGTLATGSKAEQILMRNQFKLGRHDVAHSLAAGLLGDEIETPEIVRIAAISAGHLGFVDEALGNWKQLFRISSPQDATATEAADTVLSLLQAGSDMDAALRWVHEVRAAIPSHGRSFATLWRDRLIAGDRAGLRALASESPALKDVEALELIKEATWRGCIMAAAALAVSCKLADSEQEDISAWLSTQSAAWAEEGAQALEEGRLRDAAERICAHRLLNPDALAGVRAQRAFERAMRLGVRAALVAGNHKEVIDLTDIALDTQVEFPNCTPCAAARPMRWATSRPPCATWNRPPPTSRRRSARNCTLPASRSTAAGSARPSTPTRWSWRTRRPTRAPATRPSASSAGSDRAPSAAPAKSCRPAIPRRPGTCWTVSRGRGRGCRKSTTRSAASWPCCTPRRARWNRPAPPNAWRWASASCSWSPTIPSACAWPRWAPCACTALNRPCPTGARSRNVPTIRPSSITTSSAAWCGSTRPTAGRPHESAIDHRAREHRVVRPPGGPGPAGGNRGGLGAGPGRAGQSGGPARWRAATWPTPRSASCCSG
ncbi:hypothetical protein WJ972_05005 [Achromobacter insuavis]